MKIFLSGCCGSGKTTLAKELSTMFNIPEKTNVITEVLNYKYSFEERQRIITDHLLKIHRSDGSFICDRNVLDSIHWSQSKNGNKDFDLSELYDEPFDDTLFIVSPTPSYFLHEEVYQSIFTDSKRLCAYLDLLPGIVGIDYLKQTMHVYYQQLAIDKSIKRFLTSKQIPSIFPSSSPNSYFEWAKIAKSEVNRLLTLE